MKNWLLAIVLSIGVSRLARGKERERVIISKGQVLSVIAQKYIGSPIYTKSGSLAKLLELNPQIKNPDLIFPGQKIYLSRPTTQLDQRQVASQAQPQISPGTKTSTSTKTTQRSVTHNVFYDLGSAFTTLAAHESSTNSNADLYTSHDFNFGVGWKVGWSRKFSSFAAFSMRNLDFEPSTNPSKTLANTNQSLFGMSVGGQTQFTQRFSLQYAAALGQELFLHGIDTSTVSVDAITIPQVGVKARWEFMHRGVTSDGFIAQADYLFSGSTDTYTVDPGTYFMGGIYVRHMTRSRRELNLDFGYFQRNQNTSILQFNESGIYATLTLSLPIFEDNNASVPGR